MPLSLAAALGLFVACGNGAGGDGAGAGQPPGGGDAPGTGGSAGGLPEVDPNYRPRGLPAKDFVAVGRTYAPMDIESHELEIRFNVRNQSVIGRSAIRFRQPVASRPLFLLDPALRSARLNGASVDFDRVSDPDTQNSFVALEREVPAGEVAVAELEFAIPSSRVSFRSGGVGFLTDMADIAPGRFFERWAPANLEQDIYQLTATLRVDGASSQHQLFTNGEASSPSAGVWSIRFPPNYNSSSFYMHLTNQQGIVVREFTVNGAARPIPVTVYSTDSALASQAAARIPGLFQEIEATYGPYAHPRFTAYLTKRSGGMEYVGATITSLRSLSHELFHSWFARGVMPADGRSGWIDEAIASWRDKGSQRAGSLLRRDETNLAWFSSWERGTPRNSYADGRALLAEWDLLFADRGGVRALFRDLYARYRGQVISTEELRAFLEETTGRQLDAYFTRYVYDGHSTVPEEDPTGPVQDAEDLPDPEGDSLHPPSLSEDDLEELR